MFLLGDRLNFQNQLPEELKLHEKLYGRIYRMCVLVTKETSQSFTDLTMALGVLKLPHDLI